MANELDHTTFQEGDDLEAPASLKDRLSTQAERFFEQLGAKILRVRDRLAKWGPIRVFARSLTLRITVAMTAIVVVMMAVLSVFVTSHVRDGIFERHLNQVLSDASLRSESLQGAFDKATPDSVTALQDTALSLMSETRDSLAGIGGVGVMLIRDPNNSAEQRINSIVDDDMRPLLSDDLREAVQKNTGLHWQSVQLEFDEEPVQPAIIVGTYLDLPLVGGYEFYMVYSLQNEQDTLQIITQVMMVGSAVMMLVLALTIFLVSYSSLRPISEVARASQRLSQGHLDERLSGERQDEIGQLNNSFNEMAQSLESQIHNYQMLLQLQQRFVSDVSHELRTPLTTIRMASDMFYEQRQELPALLERSAVLLYRQVDRFDKMMSDLIEISRIDAQTAVLNAQECNIVELARLTIENNALLAEKLGVEVRLEAPDSVLAEVDETRLLRIIRNLLVNAIEYAEGKPVVVTVAHSPSAVAVQVRDYGPGMKDSVAQHVFDRFYRADPSRKRTTGGTGLGLAISAEDASLHQGFLTVLSCPGQGSAFLLLIPKLQGEEIQEIPLEVSNQDLIAAREAWALDHPEDIQFTEDFSDEKITIRSVGMVSTEADWELDNDELDDFEGEAEDQREGSGQNQDEAEGKAEGEAEGKAESGVYHGSQDTGSENPATSNTGSSNTGSGQREAPTVKHSQQTSQGEQLGAVSNLGADLPSSTELASEDQARRGRDA